MSESPASLLHGQAGGAAAILCWLNQDLSRQHAQGLGLARKELAEVLQRLARTRQAGRRATTCRDCAKHRPVVVSISFRCQTGGFILRQLILVYARQLFERGPTRQSEGWLLSSQLPNDSTARALPPPGDPPGVAPCRISAMASAIPAYST